LANYNKILSAIPESEKTETVVLLLEIIASLQKDVQELKDEIARLKNKPPRPKLRPSKIGVNDLKRSNKKRSNRRNNKRITCDIEIQKTIKLKPENLPKGSILLEYRDYTVQDIIIQPNNIKYRRGIWRLPDGTIVRSPLPEHIDGHYGAELKRFILYQYYSLHVTRPSILEYLLDLGFKISVGEIDKILTQDKKMFHEEKDEILNIGLRISKQINVDDTGLRHKGKNGYCTHIGNEFFAWYKSTYTKSRVNFLELLCGRYQDYHLNEYSYRYIKEQGFPYPKILLLERSIGKSFSNKEEWEQYLKFLGIKKENHVKIATEAALLGSLIFHGVPEDLVIVSDEAGQFNIFIHTLCWLHAERKINSLLPQSDEHNKIMSDILDKLWLFYKKLKDFKSNPNVNHKPELETAFDTLFNTKTSWQAMNKALELNLKNKQRLLRVLERPEIPLHNNLSENDIREAAKKRKISAGTRGDLGRQCRDTFLSLKKTCRKLNISFWHYLYDRIAQENKIPAINQIILEKAAQPP